MVADVRTIEDILRDMQPEDRQDLAEQIGYYRNCQTRTDRLRHSLRELIDAIERVTSVR